VAYYGICWILMSTGKYLLFSLRKHHPLPLQCSETVTNKNVTAAEIADSLALLVIITCACIYSPKKTMQYVQANRSKISFSTRIMQQKEHISINICNETAQNPLSSQTLLSNNIKWNERTKDKVLCKLCYFKKTFH